MLAFHELAPRFKKLNHRASFEFLVDLDMSEIGITTFSETQAKETWEKDFKTMKNENLKIPRHRFVKQTIPN